MTDRLDMFARPSRYLGQEAGSVTKEWNDARLKVALAFPEVTEIAHSHLGLKILYGLINQEPGLLAERAVAPWLDREEWLRKNRRVLTSLESGRPLAEFDVLGFSLQYELTFTNILNMLDLAGLPVMAGQRDESMPLVIGGGPCAFNPEPLADFFDFFFLGDAEAGLVETLEMVADWKASMGSKAELFQALAGRPGIYIPSLFAPVYDSRGRIEALEPSLPGYERVGRALASDLDSAYYPESPVVPLIKPIHDRLAFEISRGCTRGCRFCQAGYIYRPVRERSPERILEIARRTIRATGEAEASFLSLSAGDYSCLGPLMSAFMDEFASQRVALSLPSLRVKSLTPDMIDQIKRVRRTGFTLAPEAGSQRLRDVINKDLSDQDLFDAARLAFGAGWRLLKLYFMIGLPTETDEDVTAIAELARRVRAGFRAKLNVSFAVFVPKAHTPFQWEPMLDLAESNRRFELLRGALNRYGLKPKWNSTSSSQVEGLLARGDRRLGPVVYDVWRAGARFEGWSEQFHLDPWRQALAAHDLDFSQYLGSRQTTRPLAWSHLSTGVAQEHLLVERDKALATATTPDCRFGGCAGCGVCDFKTVKNQLFDPANHAPTAVKSSPPQGEVVRYKIRYEKAGPMAFLSHLETVDTFVRACRRASLVFRMSQGFHPLPKIHFATPLPVGLPSRDEYLEAEFIDPDGPEAVKSALNSCLPTGFQVFEVRLIMPGVKRIRATGAEYEVRCGTPWPRSIPLENLPDKVTVTRERKGKFTEINVLELVTSIKITGENTLQLSLNTPDGPSLKPQEAVRAIMKLPENEPLEVSKLKTLFQTRCAP